MPTEQQDELQREAAALANKHYEIEEGITHIFRINQKVDVEVVRGPAITLLEVNSNTIPSGTIVPIHFGPNPLAGVKYPSTIVEVTPDEFAKISNHELELPNGWTIGEPYPRPEGSK